jgi:serine/threonine protein kinase
MNNNLTNNLINNKYKIIQKIGSGSFGTIFKGENIRTGEKVAIKIEPIQSQLKMLKNESIIYQYLNNLKGIPNVKWFGKDDNNYYMVINLLGTSLQDLRNTKGAFSLTLTLQIGIQVINLIKTIHEKGLVHRDIKPDNFLLGLNENNKQLYIIDFGFCKSYVNNNKHIIMKKTNSIIGSQTYASINSHRFNELTRRDDLESIGYMLIYLHLGKLEWQDTELLVFEEKNKFIINQKENISENKNIPDVLNNYLIYVKNLEFEETPNYFFILNEFMTKLKN